LRRFRPSQLDVFYNPVLTLRVTAADFMPRTRPFDPCFLQCRPRNSFPVFSHSPNKVGFQLCWNQQKSRLVS
jgi:hypothetical protein